MRLVGVRAYRAAFLEFFGNFASFVQVSSMLVEAGRSELMDLESTCESPITTVESRAVACCWSAKFTCVDVIGS
jgi:hypothetical protein